MQPFELTLADASGAIARRELSPVELTESVLERLTAVDDRLCAYVAVAGETALRSAARAEREIAAGRRRGPLHGIPMTLKDMIDVEGLPTSASSQVRSGHVAKQDSAVAARLDEAGAVFLGKTHTHEFASGLITPQTHNAWDQDRIAGGSSGGSAVAVAAGAATFALGTDTAGSVRVPSALNGVVGLKPTYGLIPLTGVTSLSWSLDHVGPITRTVRDAALVLAAVAGHDPGDPASRVTVPALAAAGDEEAPQDLAGVRVGVPRTYYFDHVTAEVETIVRAAVEQLAQLGAELVEVEIPMARHMLAVGTGLLVPEASAYHEEMLRATPDLYSPELRLVLEAGALVPAVDYLRAQRARTMMREAWSDLFRRVDVIAAPTVPMAAVPSGQQSMEWPDGTVESVSDACLRLCAPANITGVPALSLPAGYDGAGMPVGMQLIGRPLDEAKVLRVGRAYEATNEFRGGLAPIGA
ncbi:amidase [Streptomyces sp. NBC_01497]|uniref:amidase n=1 Tax=Streptomyces sp. NBC_01497 TaxID=2903885 RepID=UPI002E34112A|nr:amidase [Streptomyces sp. NBC_01497]